MSKYNDKQNEEKNKIIHTKQDEVGEEKNIDARTHTHRKTYTLNLNLNQSIFIFLLIIY